MSNFMDWVKDTLGMNDGEDEVQEVQEESKQPVTPFKRKNATDDIPVSNSSGHRKSKVVNINATAQLKVFVVQPLSYNDSSEIVEHLKGKKPVVVNLEKLEKPVAHRIFDFLSGAVFALDGTMKKVSNGILLIVPDNMGIMGDFCDELTTQDICDLF